MMSIVMVRGHVQGPTLQLGLVFAKVYGSMALLLELGSDSDLRVRRD